MPAISSRPLALRLTALLGAGLLSAAPGLAQTVSPTATATATCTLPPGPLPTGRRAVFVLDTSGSMRGIGDGQANIFGKVKAAMTAYVQATQPDQLELITFDSGIRSTRSYTLPADQPRFSADLQDLQADGRNTYLYRSLQRALSVLSGADRYITNVYVLTDGIDNDRRRTETAQSALNAFTERGPLDSVTYIALGTQIPRDARDALAKSSYASGLTMPVGQVPNLNQIGTGVTRVTQAQGVAVPFPEGTPVSLNSPAPGVTLAKQQVSGGTIDLHLPARLPYGTPALLCAAPPDASNLIGALPQRVLLDLNVGQAGSGIVWLNPGAGLTLRGGESVVLRYRALHGVTLDGAGLRPVAPGLKAVLERLPNAQEFAVRLTNTGTQTSQDIAPQLRLANGRLIDLPSLHLQAGQAPVGTPGRSAAAASAANPWRWAWWLLALPLAALALWFMRRRARPRPRGLPKLAASETPSIQGLEYREDRTLSLVGRQGQVSAVTTPLGGPFDLGQLSRVPLLSGLRAEQERDGLRILNIPADLEVSQGGRLLRIGDEVRPGTLLGVEVARQSRAPHAPLGSLVGLGLPLTLQPDGVTLHITGPYGTHALTLQPGITDLGEAFGALALAGLKFSTSGPNILLADVPSGLTLTRQGEHTSLKPGTYLTGETVITLPSNE